MLPCQFFAIGQCSKGKSCLYSHEPSVCRPGGAGRLCKSFAANGTCRFGDRCVFIHQSGAQPEQAYFYGKQADGGGEEDYVGFYGEEPTQRRDASAKFRPQPNSWAKVARLPNQEEYDAIADLASKVTSQLAVSDANVSSNITSATATTTKVSEAPKTVSSASSVPCKFFFSPTGCKLGKTCKFSHSEDLRNKINGTPEHIDTNTCSICFENLRFKRIGVLTHCDHLFCLKCIRGWRSSEMSEVERTKEVVQTCPVCRVRSFFVVPCDTPPTTLEEKRMLTENFRENCSRTPCRYKDSECPFGTSCMYYHERVDPAKLGLRFAKTVEGGDRALTSKVATLGDFLLK